jgi:uncharacterized membrane protein (DUF485 family)
MAAKKAVRKILVNSVSTAVALGVVYVILLVIGVIPLGGSFTDDLLTIPNLSGMEFKIIYTGRAHFLVTEYATSVYVRRADVKGESLLARLLNRETLLFRYDPANDENTLPSIQATGNDKILISIPRVSQIFFQSRKWRNTTIEYSIGHNENPELDISKPIYTMPRAIICPVSLLFDAHADHERETVNDLYLEWLPDPSFLPSTYVFDQESKAKALGCEIWQGGIRVEAAHMKQLLGGSWFVPGLSLMEISGNHFTTTDQLTNDMDQTVPAPLIEGRTRPPQGKCG